MSAPDAPADNADDSGNADAVVACPHTRCGGCAWLALPYGAQCARKQARVETALGGYPLLRDVPVQTIVGVPDTRDITGYRTREKLMVDGGGGIGLYARDGHEVIDIPDCPIMPPRARALADALRPLLRDSGVEAIDLRQVRDRGAEHYLVTLIAGVEAVAAAEALAPTVHALPGVACVAVSGRAPGAVQLLGRDLHVVCGEDAYPDRSDDAAPYVLASPGAFVQAHRGQAGRLQARVANALATALGGLRGRRILELHCGEGALGMRLAQQGARMSMVDNFPPAIDRLRRAAGAQGLSIDASAMDATDALRALADGPDDRHRKPGQALDALLLDPPRRGVDSRLRRLAADLGPKVIAYVSCAPETLARDLAHLRLLGYAADAVLPLDMIPLSAEVECIAILKPAAPAPIGLLYEDAEVVIANKPPYLPTTPQGEHAQSLLQQLRTQLDCPTLTPVHRLDATTSGACILARSPSVVAGWARALAEGDKRYLALVRGVTRGSGTIRRPLRDGRRTQAARTRYQRQRVVGGHTLVAAMPTQGRLHQVRRHLASIGHPVLGDFRHGDAPSNRHVAHRHGLDRPFLHCAHLSLRAPSTGEPIEVEAPLPGDLAAVLASLEGHHTSGAAGP